MKTESEIYAEALARDMERRGFSDRDMAARIITGDSHVSHNTVRNWIKGTTRPRASMFPAILRALTPKAVAEIAGQTPLPPKYLAEANPKLDNVREPLSSYNLTEVRPSGSRVPVTGIAKAADYCPVIHGDFAKFAANDDDADLEPWDELRPGHHLLRTDGHSGSDLFGPGSIIEINMTIPPRVGDMVVALTSLEEYPVIKYYHRKDYLVRLEAINREPGAGRSYKIDLREPDTGVIHWMHPVVKYRATPPRRTRFNME